MGKVFFDIGLTVDGYMAGPNRGPGNPLGDGGVAIHEWMFQTAYFRRLLGRSGGESSTDDALVRRVFERTGAYVMGKRMFDEGEVGWPEEAPFHNPVFVLTHTPRAPWPRRGGTTFYFVTDGLAGALEQARAAANGKDVRISGGAEAIRQYLAAGVIDEFTLHVAPLLLGAGLRLFDHLAGTGITLEQTAVSHSPRCAHLDYRVRYSRA